MIQEVKADECKKLYLSDEYENYIADYNGNIMEEMSKIDYACAIFAEPFYAILWVKRGRVYDLLRDVKSITSIDIDKLYSLSATSPINAANISDFYKNPYLSLRGNGVIVGMVDTGIDYLNEEFMTKDNKTRILNIWDQTIQTENPPENFHYGTEYSREQINEAIDAKNRGENPYDIVPHVDDIGHGTEIAGIIGGGGRGEIRGAAPECEFAIVKLKKANKSLLENYPGVDVSIPEYQSSDIVLALKHLYNLQAKLNKPMVICIALGTNYGGHDGSSVVERFIDYISQRHGIIVVGGTGNEGDAANHISGRLSENGEIQVVELSVAEEQLGIEMNLWFHKPDKVAVGIVSPSGEALERIPYKIEGPQGIKFILEQTTVTVTYYLPEDIIGDEHVSISFKDVKGGIWQIRLMGDHVVNGEYNAWTYQYQFLKPGTKFLKSNPYITLTPPCTSKNIIVASYYNQNTNTVVASSGRGYTRDGRIKPTVAVGGINAMTTKVGGGTTVISGSSVATAVLTGAVALILQWGIVEGNKPILYAPSVTTYLISGAKGRTGEMYPNPIWGYGMLDLIKVFQNVRCIERENIVQITNNVVICIPKEIYNSLNTNIL
ncbi:S8 family peptidase [uncultured Clostridium sp.]|uniref:S8 family peptidase n=1 Tax=uncultured Clostridium sp. TaxID=59620 RepID=UPI0025857085|nr:S8 family peptidase [uncultured Clostridium sp.]MDU1348546.1 S8 family peptidase [Clostridium argentinense]